MDVKIFGIIWLKGMKKDLAIEVLSCTDSGFVYQKTQRASLCISDGSRI